MIYFNLLIRLPGITCKFLRKKNHDIKQIPFLTVILTGLPEYVA